MPDYHAYHSNFRVHAGRYANTRLKSAPLQVAAEIDPLHARREWMIAADAYPSINEVHPDKVMSFVEFERARRKLLQRFSKPDPAVWQLSRIRRREGPLDAAAASDYIAAWTTVRISSIAEDLGRRRRKPAPSVRLRRIEADAALAALGLAIYAEGSHIPDLTRLAQAALLPPNTQAS